MLNYYANNFAPGNNTPGHREFESARGQQYDEHAHHGVGPDAFVRQSHRHVDPAKRRLPRQQRYARLRRDPRPVDRPGASQSELFIHTFASTTTINSKIIDNGVAGGLNVVLDQLSLGGAIDTQFNNTNTYLGTTFVDGTTLVAAAANAIPGNLTITGGNSAATDSLTFNDSNVQLNVANAISSASRNVTMNGSTQLNLNSFNNTIASLSIKQPRAVPTRAGRRSLRALAP